MTDQYFGKKIMSVKTHKSVISNEDMKRSDNFVRQRRNLMLSGSLLFIFAWSNASFEGSISVLSIEFAAGYVNRLNCIPLILCAYFLLRYFQVHSQEPKVSFRKIYIDYFSEASFRKRKKYAEEAVEKRKEKQRSQYKIRPENVMPLFTGEPFSQVQTPNSNKQHYVEQSVFSRALKFSFTPLEYKPENGPGAYREIEEQQDLDYITVNLTAFWYEHLKALFLCFFRTTHFTEFMLPYILSVCAFIYFVSTRSSLDVFGYIRALCG